MDLPFRVPATRSLIYGTGAGAVLVAASARDGADALRSLVPSLGKAVAELRCARAAENESQSTGPIIPTVAKNDETFRA